MRQREFIFILLFSVLTLCLSSIWGQSKQSLPAGQYFRAKITDDIISEKTRIRDVIRGTLISPVQRVKLFTKGNIIHLKNDRVYRAITNLEAWIDYPTDDHNAVLKGVIKLDQGSEFTSATISKKGVRWVQAIPNQKVSRVKLDIREGKLIEIHNIIPERSTLFGTVVEVKKSAENKTLDYISVMFDSLTPPFGQTLCIKAILTELIDGNDTRLDDTGKLASKTWKKDNWIFFKSEKGVILKRLSELPSSTPGDDENEIERGIEFGVVLTHSVEFICPHRMVSERIISKIDISSTKKNSLIISPDRKRVAYIGIVGNQQYVAADGKNHRKYDDIKFLLFSPDNQHIAYAGKAGDDWYLAVDRKEEKQCEYIGALLFSPDGNRMAYGIAKGNKWCVVVDGKEEKQYDEIGFLLFSPDSKHMAYAATNGNKRFVVVDGKEEMQHDELGYITFSPDSKRLVYAAKDDDKWFIITDGKKEKPYDSIVFLISRPPLIFSPDSKHIAYNAHKGEKEFVVVDGLEQKQYDGLGTLIFSPDSRHVAYMAKTNNKELVVVDGKEGKQYDCIDSLIFSPDSKSVAYAAKTSEHWLVVVDEKESEQYDEIKNMIFSPDSKHIAYNAHKGEKEFVVVDGLEQKQYDGLSTLIFSPDSRHVAYVAKTNNKELVVGDGIEDKKYDHIGYLIFSPDSKRMAYVAEVGKQQFVVVDGWEDKYYDDILNINDGKIIFDKNSTLHYLGINGKNICLVEENIK
jgi:Tol biopolymer transport system component